MENDLSDHFDALAHQLRQLISLLEETEDRFWVVTLERALQQVDEHRLSGATFVLGCYGGENTFSDVQIGGKWQEAKPIQYHNANARLKKLRDSVFASADAIASRRFW